MITVLISYSSYRHESALVLISYSSHRHESAVALRVSDTGACLIWGRFFFQMTVFDLLISIVVRFYKFVLRTKNPTANYYMAEMLLLPILLYFHFFFLTADKEQKFLTFHDSSPGGIWKRVKLGNLLNTLYRKYNCKWLLPLIVKMFTQSINFNTPERL